MSGQGRGSCQVKAGVLVRSRWWFASGGRRYLLELKNSTHTIQREKAAKFNGLDKKREDMNWENSKKCIGYHMRYHT